ncbi:NTP pyrophosphohydrolase [Streptomyces sp. DSM 41524]|uniref:NTP pyrophosphohydrolase n=1 Tax=Streptomyces asiaticus subsp. ignotus TaxID=3098222 RepID=A0ABU7Q2S0_9ACTN|nr:NTP pyrophosphohydrolase [Streptomyces sp. DASNCL29]MEE4595648.1 NTP pyrophosphohydrolase [Streptomyces sp. DSM 41524]TMU90533.1 NTP pyrophosphohydrolase [Streptomyces sp. DASNCL29]
MDGVVVVDAANVVGSVPDGWWRDRRGAAERLRDRLAVLARTGLPDRPGVPGWATVPPVDIVMVVEGAARGIEPVAGVRVESAPGSGDDHIVAVVAAREEGRPCLVVTADQELRARVTALGAQVTGPRSVRPNGSP